jgi:hypothetical protein
MTYLDAVSIQQDFIVAMQYAGLSGKTEPEAFKETAEKYSEKELMGAYQVLLKQLETEKNSIKELFFLAIRAKKNRG